ncbi:MAG: prepilin-type N-terminal cleavage/methylation domain-containing protein [bacterium]
MIIKNNQKGFTVVEVIVGLSILSIAFLGFLSLARFNFIIQEQGNKKIEAINIANEAIEIIRGIRNEDWNNIATLTVDTDYYLTIMGEEWNLVTTDPGVINDIYTRRIRFGNTYRDANDNISASGSLDSGTKKIEAIIEWNDKGITRQLLLDTYLTNWSG